MRKLSRIPFFTVFNPVNTRSYQLISPAANSPGRTVKTVTLNAKTPLSADKSGVSTWFLKELKVQEALPVACRASTYVRRYFLLLKVCAYPRVHVLNIYCTCSAQELFYTEEGAVLFILGSSSVTTGASVSSPRRARSPAIIRCAMAASEISTASAAASLVADARA